MAVDPITGLEITNTAPNPQEPSRAQERITELSEKVKTTATELQAEKDARIAAERKVAFVEGYAEILTTQPGAKDHKAEIEAKVASGYTVQDATYAVLGPTGKLVTTPAPQVPQPNPAGGSAPTQLPASGVKPVSEMSQAERRAKLADEMVWN